MMEAGNLARDSTSGSLGERITECAVEFYLQNFGDIAPLTDGIDERWSTERIAAIGLRGAPPEVLAKLSGRAISRLAERQNILSGKNPLRLTDWSVVRYSLSGARTLREAIARCSECFEAIDWRCGRMSLRIRGEDAELGLDAARRTSGPDACLVDLAGAAQISAMFAWLIARPLPLTGIWLDHPQPIVDELRLPSLPFVLHVDRGWSGFAFKASYLDHPVARNAADLANQYLGSFLFGGAAGSPAAEPLAAQVRTMAIGALRRDHRLPKFQEVVALTGKSIATVRRALDREGTCYREIRDSCRRELGLDLLRRSNLTIEEIANRLDYCDSDAFRRAFHQWMAISPSQYRRETAHPEPTPTGF